MIRKFLFTIALGSSMVYGTNQPRNSESINKINGTDTIHWRSDYKLKPQDFQGAIPIDASKKFAAETSVTFSYNTHYITDTSIRVNAVCVFNKKESWIVKKNGADIDYILLHEQGHYDMAELYCRIITNRMKIIESMNYIKNKNNVMGEVNFIIYQTLHEFDSLSDRYDLETSHNRDTLQQMKWSKMIDSMINK